MAVCVTAGPADVFAPNTLVAGCVKMLVGGLKLVEPIAAGLPKFDCWFRPEGDPNFVAPTIFLIH